MKTEYGTPRRTTIEELEFETDIEDLIQREDMVVTVTNAGWIKRVPLSTYRAQRRGGKGRAGMATKEEDFVKALYIVNTHTPVLFFSTLGMVYKLKVYKLPEGTPQSRGKAMVNLLPLKEGETISTVMPLPEDETTWGQLNVMFATASGNVRRNDLSDFVNINRSGKIAMKLEDECGQVDHLIGVATCDDSNDVLLSTRQGKCIRFEVSDVRVFAGRSSVGVRGIKLADGDEVISMSILRHVEFDTESRDAYLKMAKKLRGGDEAEEAGDEAPSTTAKVLTEEEFKRYADAEEFVLTATRKGFGKRTSAYEYRITGRGGSGIVSIATSKRNGDVVASFPVGDKDQVMMITDAGLRHGKETFRGESGGCRALPHRCLSRHLRSDHQWPPRYYWPRRQNGRPPDCRRGGECREGPALLAEGARGHVPARGRQPQGERHGDRGAALR